MGAQDKAQRIERERIKGLYRSVLSTYEGRAFFWHLTQLAGVGQSIWEQSARIHWRSGRQDFGLEMIRDAKHVDYRAWDLTVREAAQRDLKAAELALGTQTRAADQEATNDD